MQSHLWLHVTSSHTNHSKKGYLYVPSQSLTISRAQVSSQQSSLHKSYLKVNTLLWTRSHTWKSCASSVSLGWALAAVWLSSTSRSRLSRKTFFQALCLFLAFSLFSFTSGSSVSSCKQTRKCCPPFQTRLKMLSRRSFLPSPVPVSGILPLLRGNLPLFRKRSRS